jgi:quinol monooxygenase YgiN
MQVVVSQAHALDAGAHADEYVRLSGEFTAFMRQHPGFLGRRLLRSIEDPTHFTHVRLFDSIASYEELTRLPGYHDRIAEMAAHVHQPASGTPREYFETVIDEDPLPPA